MHALNEAHAVELSSMSAEDFARHTSAAWRVLVSPPAAGFVIALDHTARPDSPNHAWFRARLERFAYIDRVVVDSAARGRGVARALYDAVIAQARADNLPVLTAEVNADPPNPASDAFHDRFGFTVMGEARLADRGKTVRYFSLTL